MKQNSTLTVDGYIANCPKNVQEKLQKVRGAIKEIAPDAKERTDYFQMPGYSYEGYDYDGMFVWFSYKDPFIRLHVRPPVLQDYKKDLLEYQTTKGILSFPEDQDIPIALVKKLVQASLRVMKNK